MAQRIRLRPGFESQAHHLPFNNFIFELFHSEKTKVTIKEAGIGPLKNYLISKKYTFESNTTSFAINSMFIGR